MEELEGESLSVKLPDSSKQATSRKSALGVLPLCSSNLGARRPVTRKAISNMPDSEVRSEQSPAVDLMRWVGVLGSLSLLFALRALFSGVFTQLNEVQGKLDGLLEIRVAYAAMQKKAEQPTGNNVYCALGRVMMVPSNATAQPCANLEPCETSLVRNSHTGALHRCKLMKGKSGVIRCITGPACEERVPSEALAFDIGFFNGDDTALLLMQGYRVVAIEANAALVQRGRRRFARAIKRGQLLLLNRALNPTLNVSGTRRPFYVNRHNLQWSSFHEEEGCRTPGKSLKPRMRGRIGQHCDVHSVITESCGDLFERYGVPLLLKLGIEASKWPCMNALRHGLLRPSYLSFEARPYNTEGLYKLLNSLGYTNFKWVSQAALNRTRGLHGWGESSGPIGEAALDCHFGYGWRDYESIKELHASIEDSKENRWRNSEDTERGRRRSKHGMRCGRLANVHARHLVVHRRFEPWSLAE